MNGNKMYVIGMEYHSACTFIHPYLYLNSYAEVFGRRIVEHTEAPRLDDMLGMRFGDLMNDIAFADCIDSHK